MLGPRSPRGKSLKTPDRQTMLWRGELGMPGAAARSRITVDSAQRIMNWNPCLSSAAGAAIVTAVTEAGTAGSSSGSRLGPSLRCPATRAPARPAGRSVPGPWPLSLGRPGNSGRPPRPAIRVCQRDDGEEIKTSALKERAASRSRFFPSVRRAMADSCRPRLTQRTVPAIPGHRRAARPPRLFGGDWSNSAGGYWSNYNQTQIRRVATTATPAEPAAGASGHGPRAAGEARHAVRFRCRPVCRRRLGLGPGGA